MSDTTKKKKAVKKVTAPTMASSNELEQKVAAKANKEIQKIDKLTPEQEARFPEFVERWTKIGLSTAPCDFEKAKAAAKRIYKDAGLEEPDDSEMYGPFDNPLAAAEFEANVLCKGERPVPEAWQGQIYGNQEAPWMSFYEFMRDVVGVDLPMIQGFIDMAESCGWWTPLAGACIFQHRPLEIHLDDRKQLHNEDGPAIKFRGEDRRADVWAIHNIRVTERIVMGKFEAKEIFTERNQEIRRIMTDVFIRRYGPEKFAKDSGAKQTGADDFATVWRIDIPDDESAIFAEVVNSSAEPDGTFKNYWLRVDPTAYEGRAAKEGRAAIASTWRRKDGSLRFATPEDYDPEIET